MPIKLEHKNKYPKDWKEISARIRNERAKNKCEWCKAPNGSIIFRGNWNNKPVWQNDDGNIYSAGNGEHITDNYVGDLEGNVRMTKVVLTVAHLDHNPENSAEENLKALCQRCHLNYDKTHHMLNSRATREKNRGLQRLNF